MNRKNLVILFFIITSYAILYGWYTGVFSKTEAFTIQTVDTPAIQKEISNLPPLAVTYQPSLKNPGLIEVTKYMDMPLSNWCIKGAHNAPRSGHYVSTEAIEYVLDKGCRWLDIEAYYVAQSNDDGSPIYDLYCGGSPYSSDTAPTSYNQSSVFLSSVIHKAIQYGFDNTSDPLFISIRFRIQRSDFGSASQKLAQLLQTVYSTFPDRIYDGSVSPKTPIRNLLDKVVFGVEASVADYSVVGDYVQMSLPGDGWAVTYESRLWSFLTSNTKLEPNPNAMTVMYPDGTDSGKNLPALESIRKFGFQVPLIKYYLGEATELDALFDSYQTGMVPISFLL
jgi:hypothetical protein